MMYRKNRWNRKDMSGNKYKASKIETTVGKFDSKLEFKRYLYLKSLQDEGRISDLTRQVPYTLIPSQKDHTGKVLFREIRYVSDFEYNLPSGEHVVEDTKGIVLPVFKLKQKLMYYFFGIEVKVVRKW